MCLEIEYLIYLYTKDFPLNNQQWLIRDKTQSKQIKRNVKRGIHTKTTKKPNKISSSFTFQWQMYLKKNLNECTNKYIYLSLPPTRQDLTQGQKTEGQLKWG